MSLREEILYNNTELDFVEGAKYDDALVGVVEKFGGEFEPLYDFDILKSLPIPHDKLNEFKGSCLFRMTLEEACQLDKELLDATGYDDQVLGLVSKYGEPSVIVYDTESVIEAKTIEIESEEGYEEDSSYPAVIHAMEDYSYNFIGGYLGPKTWKCATIYTKNE